MSTQTIERTRTLPALDRPDADQIADEILLGTALSDHKAVGKVKGVQAGVRGWTRSGNVD